MNNLTSAYNTVTDSFINYASLIPKNTLTECAKSFALSFTVATVLSINPVHGLICGTVAATASLVSALASPFFDQTRNLTGEEAFFRACFAVTVAASLGAAALGTAKNIQNLMFGFAAINIALRFFSNVTESPRYTTTFIMA